MRRFQGLFRISRWGKPKFSVECWIGRGRVVVSEITLELCSHRKTVTRVISKTTTLPIHHSTENFDLFHLESLNKPWKHLRNFHPWKFRVRIPTDAYLYLPPPLEILLGHVWKQSQRDWFLVTTIFYTLFKAQNLWTVGSFIYHLLTGPNCDIAILLSKCNVYRICNSLGIYNNE